MADVMEDEKMEDGNDGWEKWLYESWYGDIVEYKTTGRLSSKGRTEKVMRQIKKNASKYVLLLGDIEMGRDNELLYREVTGELSKCVRKEEL